MFNERKYVTHDFLPTCDNVDSSSSQKSIRFYDFFPRVHSKFIVERVIPLILKAELEFVNNHYREICKKKKKFNTPKNAKESIKGFIHSGRGRKITNRYYKCKVCDKYHTTSSQHSPTKHFYLHEESCHLFIYSNNTAVLKDVSSNNKIYFNYLTQEKAENNKEDKITIEKIEVKFSQENDYSFILSNRKLAKGSGNDNRGEKDFDFLVNSAHISLPSDRHKNIHRFAGWLSLITIEEKFFYACAQDKNGNNGIVIIPESGKSNNYLCQLVSTNGTDYKLKITEITTTLSTNGNMSFTGKDCTSNYRATSEFFVFDKMKMQSRLKELGKINK